MSKNEKSTEKPPEKLAEAGDKTKGTAELLVAHMRFVGPQDGPGLSVASNVRGSRERPKTGKGWRIVHKPELVAFEVTYYPADGDPKTEYIPVTRVMSWAYFA